MIYRSIKISFFLLLVIAHVSYGQEEDLEDNPIESEVDVIEIEDLDGDEENDEELQGEVADWKLLLADLRGELANTKKAALDKFEAHRQGQLQSSQAENR